MTLVKAGMISNNNLFHFDWKYTTTYFTHNIAEEEIYFYQIPRLCSPKVTPYGGNNKKSNQKPPPDHKLREAS